MFILKLILSLTILLNIYVSAQNLFFCEGVTEDGRPINYSDMFYIPYDGGYLYFLVILPDEVDCESVTFTIYKIDKYGNENFFDEFDLNTNEDWNIFWAKYTFYKTGHYKVYVSDCFGYELVDEEIKIQFK